MANEESPEDRLFRLNGSQLDHLIAVLRLSNKYLSPSPSPPATRAAEILGLLQQNKRLGELSQALERVRIDFTPEHAFPDGVQQEISAPGEVEQILLEAIAEPPVPSGMVAWWVKFCSNRPPLLVPLVVFVWGMSLDLAAWKLGIHLIKYRGDPNAGVVEVGYWWHLHWSIWHAILVPVALYLAVCFYQSVDQIIQELVQTRILDCSEAKQCDRLAIVLDLFRADLGWIDPAFYLGSSAFVGVYCYNIGCDLFLTHGWEQVNFDPQNYIGDYQGNRTTLSLFSGVAYVGAIVSQLALIHFVFWATAFVRTLIRLFPPGTGTDKSAAGTSDRTGIKAPRCTLMLKYDDIAGKFGLRPLQELFDSFHYIGAIFFAVPLMNRIAHIFRHPQWRPAEWTLYVSFVIFLALLFLLPPILVWQRLMVYKSTLRVKMKNAENALRKLESQRIWPAGKWSPKVMLIVLIAALLLPFVELIAAGTGAFGRQEILLVWFVSTAASAGLIIFVTVMRPGAKDP